ncbi:MAG: glutaredoxin family protein [Luminiphilus sp.]|jgi:glutaredoxin|uniref:Glutaredoxin family protein n=1 Tax=Candidatus Paraluminiphilus aquimaris TaxID=2518994 RepID=A0ABY6Q793_9GAMM|nr:glutaredoxin family protein [Candidatus Paraluminiphilus aquimaris]MAJ53174.1 thioredoxin family protein [Halieaceae bacterium]MCH1459771.1 glutaredoxin family protein [Luminiphilus sp.]OUV02731.1 MAG: thioredoxin family protein [Cellvibrionales bacterium TMED79]UZP74783.1 glutaredoxin family protein [Candidatus Paraluminiphilus aquimaris]
MSLTLYTSPGCHLCEQAEEMLDYLGLAFNAVDISRDVDLIRIYGVRIPVLQRSDKAELGWPFDTLDIERFYA